MKQPAIGARIHVPGIGAQLLARLGAEPVPETTGQERQYQAEEQPAPQAPRVQDVPAHLPPAREHPRDWYQ